MNAANLQIEGLLMAVAAVNRCLVTKDILSRDEIERALAQAEAAITGDDRAIEDLTPANRDAVAFPIRLLRAANARDEAADFASLTRSVGQNKGRYNDQQ
ncbi:MAG: hypothetical protein ACK4G5_03590 [Devosia sp.]